MFKNNRGGEMNIKLQSRLYKKYSKIFAQKDLSIQESAMPWELECGDGWYWLVDNLCRTIQSYLKHNDIENKIQIEVTQVKEKYGGLRFYYQGGDKLIDGMVWLAENLSYKICEQCGATEGVTQTKGWIVTLCPKCMKEYKEKHK